MKKIINSFNAPAAIGPYVQGYVIGDTAVISGQLPLIPGTKKMPDEVSEQTIQSMKNIIAILDEAGFKKEDIVKCDIFVKDLKDFAIINKAYEEILDGHKPARATVEVARLPLDAKVEIAALAMK